jgi:hypothetical protein
MKIYCGKDVDGHIGKSALTEAMLEIEFSDTPNLT